MTTMKVSGVIMASSSRYKLHNSVMYVRYESKRMQPICKIGAPCFDKKRATLLWFASGFLWQAQNTVLRHFAKRAAVWRNAPHFHG